nr:MAG TPA: hypothetical protein [Caudoviricetes sp.]
MGLLLYISAMFVLMLTSVILCDIIKQNITGVDIYAKQ